MTKWQKRQKNACPPLINKIPDHHKRYEPDFEEVTTFEHQVREKKTFEKWGSEYRTLKYVKETSEHMTSTSHVTPLPFSQYSSLIKFCDQLA